MNILRVLILLLLLSSQVVPTLAVDPLQAGEQMISGGIQAFFVDTADSILNVGFNATGMNGSEIKEHGPVIGSIFKIATYENDPYSNSIVQTIRTRTAIIAVFIFILFVFYGAACVNLSCAGMRWIERTQYIISKSAFSEYKDTLITAFGAIFFTHYLFRLIIMFNQAVTTQAMYNAVDTIQISQSNWVMYIAMAVCYGLESIFLVMRIILMDLIAGADILLGVLFAFSFTREFCIETIKYFGKITLLQFIIVLLTGFGISIINESPYFQPLGYLCLIIIIVVISGGIILGFARMFRAAKVIVRRPYYSVY